MTQRSVQKQEAVLLEELEKLDRERRLETLNQICNQQRGRLAFWQEMNLDDPAARTFVEILKSLLEINGSLIERLESSAKPIE